MCGRTGDQLRVVLRGRHGTAGLRPRRSVHRTAMKRTSTFVIVLFCIACGPPQLGDSHGEGESGDDGTATSATSATTTTTTETSGTESTESTETGFDTHLPGFALP